MSHEHTCDYNKLVSVHQPVKENIDNDRSIRNRFFSFLSRKVDGGKPIRCTFCDLDIPQCGIDEHTKRCKERIVYCQLCDHTMPVETFIDHIYKCSRSCFDSYYFLGDRDYNIACTIKYNARYPHCASREIPYDELILQARKNVFFHPTETNKNQRFANYTWVKKRRRILLDLVEFLPDMVSM